MWRTARGASAPVDVVFALFPFEAAAWTGQLLEPLTVVDTSTAVLKPLQPPAQALVLPKPTRKYWSGWFGLLLPRPISGRAVRVVGRPEYRGSA